jgi:hypothetical protein
LSAFVSNPEYARDIAARLRAHRLPPQHFADAPVGGDDVLTVQPPPIAPEEVVRPPETVITAPPPPRSYGQRILETLKAPVTEAQRWAEGPGAANLKTDLGKAVNAPGAARDWAAGPGGERLRALSAGAENLKEDIGKVFNPLGVYKDIEEKKADEAARYVHHWEPNKYEEGAKPVSATSETERTGEKSSAPVSAPGGSYVPAHEVPRVSPERQEANAQTYQAEAAAEAGAAEAEAKSHEGAAQAMREAAETQQADLEESKGQRAARAELTSRMLRDAEKAAADVSSQKIDPNRFWKNTSTGDRIRYAIAAALGGFAGDHTATNMIQSMISQDIDAQKSDIENQRQGANAKMTHYHAALQAYDSMDAASEHDRAAKLAWAKMQVDALMEESKAPIVRERGKALQAQIARKMVDAGIAFNPLIPGQMVGGGPAAGDMSHTPLEVTGQADTATLQDGREIFIPKGGEDIKKGIRNQEMAIDAAHNLTRLMASPPTFNPLSPQEYREWMGQANFYLKQAALAEAGAHGGAGGGSLGKLKAEANALDQQQKAGADPSAIATWWQMRMGRQASLAKAAHELATKVGPRDLDEMIKSSGAYVGHSTIIPGRKPGEPGKPGFVATGRYKSAYSDENSVSERAAAVPQMHATPPPTGGQ